MKIYLGGSSDDLQRIKDMMFALQLDGHTITHDWTAHFDEAVKDYVQFAHNDISGIHSADTIILIFEKPLTYRGTFTELGLAIAWRKPVIILGTQADKNIFSRLDNIVICYSGVDVLKLLNERERRRTTINQTKGITQTGREAKGGNQ